MTVLTEKLLRDRSVQEGNCLLWTQGMNQYGPCISLSRHERGRSVRPLAFALLVRPVPPGKFVFVVCRRKACISPLCMRCGTKSDYMRNAAEDGAYSTPIKRAAMQRVARARSNLTIETARAVRAAALRGQSYASIGREFGRSTDWAWKVATGQMWREPVSAFPT